MRPLTLYLTTISLFFIGLSGCDDPQPEPFTGIISIHLNHVVKGQTLDKGVVKYLNASGNEYSVNRLEYFLSNFALIDDNNNRHPIGNYRFINIKDSATLKFQFDNVPQGDYSHFAFYFGLDSIQNVPHGLPNTEDNIGMIWPEPMGGGYHFMKMEGKFRDSLGLVGYALHQGTNLTGIEVSTPIRFNVDENPTGFQLTMDINEWFTNPYDYDLEIDGNYTMGDTVSMKKIAANGATVFNLKKLE